MSDLLGTNQFTNPRADSGNTGDRAGNSATLSIVPSTAGYGEQVFRATATGVGGAGIYSPQTAGGSLLVAEAGKTYTFRAKLAAVNPSQNVRLGIEWRNSGGVVGTTFEAYSAALGERVVSGVAPAGTTRVFLSFYFQNAAVGNTLDSDGWLWGEGLLPYFDGESIDARWTDERNPFNSTSELLGDTVGDRLYDALQPIAQPYDAARGYPLQRYADAIGMMFQPVEDIARDLDALVNPDTAPVGWLPWLGQFVGQPIAEIGPAETYASYRARVSPLIKNPPHQRRGTVSAIVEEVQSFLNAPRTVYVTERQGGNARIGALGVIVAEYKAGTTLAKIQARVNAVKPAGRQITVSEVSGLNWQALRDTHTDWTDVRSTFVDWNEVRTNPTKQ